MDKIKGMYKSLTIWVNGIAAVIIPSLPMLADSIPQMQPYLTPSLYQWIGGIVVALNIALRFKTNKSLADK
jgi:hypothetical protein